MIFQKQLQLSELEKNLFSKIHETQQIPGDLIKLEFTEEQIEGIKKNGEIKDKEQIGLSSLQQQSTKIKKTLTSSKIPSQKVTSENHTEESKKKEEPPIIEKKYKLISGAIIKLPENYSTDDEDEKKIVDAMNDTREEGWEEARKKDPVTVWKKKIEGTNALMFKVKAVIPYPFETVFEAINNVDIRVKWDSGSSNFELLDSYDKDGYSVQIQYSLMKLPIISNRDWVKLQKCWKGYAGNEKSALFFFTSTEHPKYPPKDNPVRGQFYLNGIYLEEKSPGTCNLTMINHADIKQTSMIGMVNRKAPDSPLNFVLNLIKGCKSMKK